MGTLLSSGCDVLRGQAPGRTAWRLPAQIAAQGLIGGTTETIRADGISSNGGGDF